MAKTYTIDRHNGEAATASSMKSAIDTAKRMLGANRVYRGAEYQTDRPGKDGEREYCTGLDIWLTKSEAARENNAPAHIVISWVA